MCIADMMRAREDVLRMQLDSALSKVEELKTENAKLRELVVRMRPICVEGKRCTFADRIYINSTMEELRIEVPHD